MPRSPLDEAIAQTEAHIAKLQDVLEKLREAKAATESILPDRRGLSRIDRTDMDTAHKLAISRGRSTSKIDADFKAAYRSKNYTLTTLAEAVDVDPSLLSKYRRKLRRVPQELTERIAALIPWPADSKHWPCGIVPTD